MKHNVLISGGAGFIASELARELLVDPSIESVFLIVRDGENDSAQAKFDRVVDHWNKFFPQVTPDQRARIKIVNYDLCTRQPFPEIGPIRYFVHAAASTDLGMQLGEARSTNLHSTQRALEIARSLPGLERFVYMSTAYVSGKMKGLIGVDHKNTRFTNHYERSKYEAEHCVRDSGLPFTILRPSIVVGRSDNGYFRRLKVLYSVWRIWLYGAIPRAPLDPKSRVDFVPIDYVVNSTIKLMRHPQAQNKFFHQCVGQKCISPFKVMLVAVDVFKVKKPPLSPPWVAYALSKWPIRKFVNQGLLDILHTMYHHIHYIGTRGRMYDTSVTDKLLEPEGLVCPGFEDFGEVMFKFCYETSWGKRGFKDIPQGRALSSVSTS